MESTPWNEWPPRFVQWDGFRDFWRHHRLDDDDLRDLERALLRNPRVGQVIPGTGGLRKMRFAPAGGARGKSGACRVCYALFPNAGTILLVTAYAKSQAANLSPGGKRAIRALLAEIHGYLRA